MIKVLNFQINLTLTLLFTLLVLTSCTPKQAILLSNVKEFNLLFQNCGKINKIDTLSGKPNQVLRIEYVDTCKNSKGN